MHGIFTNALWYIEFFAFAGALIAFFFFILYLADINYVHYNPKFDKRKQVHKGGPKKKTKEVLLPHEQNQTPLCCEASCIWFCRLVGSITLIAVCYYFAYSLISDTKLKFGIFVP